MAGPKEVNAEPIASLPDTGPVVMVNLLRLRDRAAYLDMMRPPEYAAANAHREPAAAKHVILAAAETDSKMTQAR